MPVSYVVLDEDFANGSGPGMSAQWIYSAASPVFEPDCFGNWAVSMPHIVDPNSPSPWMFHPIAPIDPYVQYQLTFTASSPFTFDANLGPQARGIICWFNPNTGVAYSSEHAWVQSEYCTEVYGGAFPYPQPADPDAQFGVLLTLASGLVMGDPADAYLLYEHVRVVALQERAHLKGYVLLGGPYDPVAQRMRADLNLQGLIPLTEPFTAMGFPQIGGGGGETTTPAVLAINHFSNGRVVDWVRLELRAIADPSQIVAVRHGLLMQNGLIISAAGQSGVLFDAPFGGYYIAVRPRNHLGVVTQDHWMVPAPYGGVWTHDFRNPALSLYGTEPVQQVGTNRLLWPGNALFDDVVKYTGTANDRDAILQAIGGAVPTNTVTGQYRQEDVNMDGVVKYVGSDNDRDIILQTIGGSTPTAVRVEQVP